MSKRKAKLAKKKDERKDESQREKFIKKAREIECDESEETLDRALRVVTESED